MDESTPTEKTLAGQQQEPWQSYSPPAADNDTFSYPQSAQGAPGHEQAFARPAPGYPSYGVPGEPAPGQTAQDFGYPGQQDLPPGWQVGMPASAASGDGETRGFFAALFDFGFTSFVTPKIVKALYVLFTFWTLVWALIFMRIGFKYGGAAGGIFTLVVVDPIFLLLTLGVSRMVLEFFVVTHRIHDEVKAIRDRDDERE
jgi:hypothetical protein